MERIRTWCSRCWCELLPTMPRVVVAGRFVCASCAYEEAQRKAGAA